MSGRKSSHLSDLRRNIHINSHLQNAFNKYYEKSFEFEILEVIEDKSTLTKREDYWVYFYKSNDPEFGYNIRKFAENNFGFHHSKETIQKIIKNRRSFAKEENPNYGKKASEETKKRSSESHLGNRQSEETKRKISENHPDISGEKHPSAKLTNNQVIEIIKMLKEGMRGMDIAKIFGICQSTISLIKHGKAWKSIDRG